MTKEKFNQEVSERIRVFTYLLCPYSHPDPTVREYRFKKANEAAAKLMSEGHIVFSPISHSHPIAVTGKIDALDCGFWLDQDLEFMRFSKLCVVLELPGWGKSKGIKKELVEADRQYIPVRRMAWPYKGFSEQL